ncbi:MAG: hypothetical protein U0T84_01780 [Chitinophagales bacterium]
MKKLLLSGALLLSAGMSTAIYAAGPETGKHEFKNTIGDISFDIERSRSEVVLHFQSEFFKDFEQILVERSGEGSGGFNGCKVITLAEIKLDGNYYRTTDRFPLSAQRDSYYRIKTIAKDGVTKTFPPILLPAVQQ